jgi:hypothetical protein
MNVDRLRRLATALRSREFPEHVAFNLCYVKHDFASGDLTVDADGDLYDTSMDVKLHVNGKQPKGTDWCGTCCCNAGMTIMLFEPLTYWDKSPRFPAYQLAQKLLGLDDDEAEQLFIPDPRFCPLDWEKVTPEQSADVIDNLIATGKVDWFVIAPLAMAA